MAFRTLVLSEFICIAPAYLGGLVINDNGYEYVDQGEYFPVCQVNRLKYYTHSQLVDNIMSRVC